MTGASGPLAGIRIVEFDAIGPVPLAAMMFADMGAEVVRLTRPSNDTEAWEDVGGGVLHRGREAIEIDLKTEHRLALDIIAGADALIEGMRPGVMERLGLGPEPCLAANPRLVYGRITGWGQSGPLAARAGHDINYIGLTGVLNAIGPSDAPPPVPLNLIGDYGGGTMFLVTGVLAALLSARETGRGQVVDTAMTDGVSTLSALFRAFMATGQWRRERQANLLDGAAPHYRCYRCEDGRHLAVGALEPRFFRQFLTGLGLEPDAYAPDDNTQWPLMAERFAAIIASRPRDHWAEVFADVDACVTPVLDWDEARAHPHSIARDAFHEVDGAIHPAPAPRFSGTPSAIRPAGSVPTGELLARWRDRVGQPAA